MRTFGVEGVGGRLKSWINGLQVPMGFKNQSGGTRGNELERQKVVVGERSVRNRDYGRVENVDNDHESEMAKAEWTTRSLQERKLRN